MTRNDSFNILSSTYRMYIKMILLKLPPTNVSSSTESAEWANADENNVKIKKNINNPLIRRLCSIFLPFVTQIMTIRLLCTKLPDAFHCSSIELNTPTDFYKNTLAKTLRYRNMENISGCLCSCTLYLCFTKCFLSKLFSFGIFQQPFFI